MKILSLSRHGYIVASLNAFLAIGLTVISFQYVQPKDCYRFCAEEMPCPAGACRFGEQKAGWPLAVFADMPGGGSPTGGWGLLGPEDLPLILPLVLDVLFYSALLWLLFYIIRIVHRQTTPLPLIMTTLPLTVFLAVSAWIFYLVFGYYAPIGRGHSVQVYIDTPTDRGAGLAFSPIILIPLKELIENYGDPDDVWLASEGSAEKPVTRMLLHWASIGMFARLAEIPNKTYTVKEMSEVELIIFPYEEPVIGLDGKPLGEKKIPWIGYGDYQP